MKEHLENFIIALIGFLLLFMAILIVLYNLIGETPPSDYSPYSRKPLTQEEKVSSYLHSLESYGNDKDIAVDPTKEVSKNVVKIKPEVAKKEAIERVVEEDTQQAYIKSVENYSKKKETTSSSKHLEEVALTKRHNGDTISQELDAIVNQ